MPDILDESSSLSERQHLDGVEVLSQQSIVGWEDALLLYERYEHHSDIPALELAIASYRSILQDSAIQLNMIGHHRVLSALGQALTRRFTRFGKLEDLDEAISLLKDALRLAQGTTCVPDITAGLVDALCTDYQARGAVLSVENAVNYGRQALDSAPRDSQDYGVALVTISRALAVLYIHSDSKAFFDEALELARHAVKLCLRDQKMQARGLHVLGALPLVSLNQVAPRNILDLEKLLHAALQLRLPGHCDRHYTLNVLANHIDWSNTESGPKDDIEKQISLRREALSLCPVGHLDRPLILCNLAGDICKRWAQTSNYEDLSEAIAYSREVLALRGREDPNRFLSLTVLAVTLVDDFEWRGPKGMDSIDEAIRLLREALNIHPRGHRRHDETIRILADLLCSRYHKGSRDLHDIHQAIDLLRDCSSMGSISPDFLSQMAFALYLRYQHVHHVEDYVEGLALISQLKTLGSLPLQVRIQRLSAGLVIEGSFLLTRFDHCGRRSDLDAAIKTLTEASGLSGIEQDAHIQCLSLLAVAHTRRSLLTTHPSSDDVEAVKIAYSRLEDICPIENAARALWMLHRAEFEIQLGCTSLLNALQLTHEALINNNCSAQWRLEGAFRVLDILGHQNITHLEPRGVADTALRSYAAAVQLLPEVAVLGLDIASRLSSVGRTDNLVMSAVDFGVMCARLEEAVEIVEQCRSFFWRQALNLRTPLDGLPRELCAQIAQISADLERESFVLRPTGPSPINVALADEQANARRRKQTEQLRSLAEQARAYPGFEYFMLPDKFQTLARAAAHGPVVLLFPSAISSGTNVMILHSDGCVRHLHLPEAGKSWLTDLKATWNNAMEHVRNEVRESLRLLLVTGKHPKGRPTALDTQRQVLERLWKSIVQPVLDHLGFKKTNGRERPRVWWCCGGDFAFLPLHAAGVGDEGCWSYAVSSYTPSLAALLATQTPDTRYARPKARILLSAVSSTDEGFAPLPSTVHEVAAIASTVPRDTCIPLPPNEDHSHVDFAGGITVQTMLDRIQDANILHLACHATQHASNPLESAFILRDGRLTIAQLMAVPLPNAFFAFLSACETAKGDVNYPEQTIHLGATMMFAGFKSVIGTMWSMDDVDGPVVARKVYERLFEGDSEFLDPDRIPYALDEAAGLLRAQGLPPGRWAPYIHLGR